MVTIQIDRVLIPLPTDFELTITLTNSYINSEGDGSYDLDLDLNHPTVAKLYSFIDRAHQNISPMLTGREVIITINNKQYIGSEAILGVQIDGLKSIVKIQILLKNSAFNYAFSDTKKIWEYDYGTFAPTYTEAQQSLYSQYPDFKYVCAPYFVSEPGEIGSNSDYNKYLVNGYLWPSSRADYPEEPSFNINRKTSIPTQSYTDEWYTTMNSGFGISEIAACPYLLYIIERFFSNKGMTILENHLLLDERTKHLYLLNPSKTNVVSNMLPDWTEIELINYIRQLFNCYFDISDDLKTVSILKMREILSLQRSYINDVFKTEEIQYDSKRRLSAGDYSNPTYDFSNNYSKFQILCTDVINNSNIIPCATMNDLHLIFPNNGTIQDAYNLNEVANYNKKTIYYVTENDTYFIPNKFRINNGRAGSVGVWIDKYALYAVNIFRTVEILQDSSISIKIVPVRLISSAYIFTYGGNSGWHLSPQAIFTQYPACNEFRGATASSLSSIIQNGVNETHASTMDICLYAGVFDAITTLSPLGSSQKITVEIPYSYNDKLDLAGNVGNYGYIPSNYTWDQLRESKFKYTLRLVGEDGMIKSFYNENYINLDKLYLINFRFKPNLKLPLIQVIDNKEYLCEKIEFRVNKFGVIDETVKGYLYALNT